MNMSDIRHRFVFFTTIVILTAFVSSRGHSQGRFDKTLIAKREFVDTKQPISEILAIEILGRDSIIFRDRSKYLKLFINNIFIKTIGRSGQGPGEYTGAASVSVEANRVYIFDDKIGKLVWYNISNDSFIGEMVDPQFARFQAFKRLAGTTFFFHTTYTKRDSSNKPLLFTLNLENKLIPQSVRFSDLEIGGFPYPAKMQPAVRANDSQIYIYFPFSNKIIVFDSNTQKTKTINLKLDHPFKKEHELVYDGPTFKKAVDDIDLSTGVFLLKKHIAVVVRNGTSPRRDWRIRFYSYDGAFDGELRANNFVFNVTDEYFSELVIETDQQSQFPYGEYRYSYQFVK